MATPHSFGAQNFPFGVLSTFGTTHIAHSAIGGQLLGSKVVGYTPTDEVDDGYNLQPVGKLKSISAMPAHGSSSHEELRWEDYQIGMAPYPSGAQNFPFGITSRLGITNTTKKHVVLSHRGSDFVGVNSTQPASKFESISAMAVYKDRSHEELRWEDYQMERNPFMFGAQSFPFGGQRLGTRVVSYTPTVEVDCGGSTQPTVKPISPMSYSSTALNSPFVTTHRYGTTAIGRPAFGGQSLGSHVVSYTPTAEIELGIIQSASKIQSISAMQVLKDKSHEEMRWEDYQLGYKGRSDLAFQSAANVAVFGKPLKQPNFPYPSGLNLPAITNTNSYGLFQSAAPSLEQTTSVIGLNFTPSSIQPRGVVDNLFSSNSKQFVEPVLTSGAFLCNNCGQTQAGPSGFGGETSQDIVGQSPISQSAMIMQDLVNLFRTPLEYGSESEPNFASRTDQRLNQIHDSDSYIKKDSTITLTGERGEDVIGADIEPLMPKLRHTDYYTEPRIQELAARERNETGFCRHVKDFVIGRLGYGSIKFTGDTDVVGLDLESLVGFNHREVVVYMKSSKNPHEGQFYNKDAEVTLLNIMCIDKKTGQKYTEGPKVEKYKKMLMKSAEEQGAESVSYDPVKGEWKLKVKHFNLSDQQGEDC